MFTLTLSSYFGSPGSPWENWLHINWQLSKQGILWPVLPDCIEGSGVDPSRSSIFLKLSADKLLVFKWSQAHFFKFIWNVLCSCHYGPALLTFWFQTDLGRENSASYLKIQAGKTFLTMVTFYIQFLCSDWSKFERWVHAASWNLFTSTAEADRVLFQLVMFLTVFFHWMYKYIWRTEPSVIHGWFVYWVFGWEMRRLSKSEIQFRMASFSFFYLARSVREFKSLLDSFQELHFDW